MATDEDMLYQGLERPSMPNVAISEGRLLEPLKHPPPLWILSGIALSLCLPVVGSIISAVFFPEARFAHLPVHSLVEAVGGLMAVSIAAILVAERSRKKDVDHYVWMASALIGMGVLDLFHAGVLPGNNFVWLHSTATFVGGVFFACVWMPGRVVRGRFGTWLPWRVLAITVAFGVISCFSSRIPAMASGAGEFTILARGLNIGGGFGFLVAGLFFVRRFHRHAEETDWLFAVHTMLFGAAGVLFELSILWDAAWWWWHILRLIAYVAAFIFAVGAYLNTERAVLSLNHELTKLNQELDQTVEARTSELRASEERYALAVCGSADGLWDWDVLTGQVYYSPRFKELLGYNDDEFSNVFESFESHLHAEDLDGVKAAIQAHVQEHLPYDVEYRLRTKSDQYRWFRARGQAIWDDAGNATRMAGSITDITEQKLTQERFRCVIEAAPNAMIVVNRGGRIQLVNAATEQMFGYSRGELVGESIEVLVPNQSRAEHVGRRNDYFLHPAARSMGPEREVTGQRRNGQQFFVEIGLSPFKFNGEMVVLSSVYDATKRKQAENSLVAAKEAAESANRAKSEFLANMSHEIRTPMNAIIGMTELVLETETNRTQSDYLTIVLESAESLLTIINQILDFSKIESGRLELESRDFNLHEEVGDTLKFLGHRAHAKQLELAWHIDEDVPRYLRGDAARLRQVLVNLVGNAIKFTDQGEVIIDIRCQSSSDSRVTLECTVRDTGVGIPEDRQEPIFAAFEQADTSTTRQFGGSGLGLAISARIVEAMNGRIWIDSAVGHGSRFYFTAELQLGNAPAEEDHLQDADVSDLSIVVVDDNETNRRILKQLLESWGIDVVTAATGPQAMEALEGHLAKGKKHPILLSDVHMPKMDGFMLVQEIRSQQRLKDTPIILLTSGDNSGDAQRCEQLGIKIHLMKPAKRSELLEAITSAAGRRVTTPKTSGKQIDSSSVPILKILLVEDGKANQIMAMGMLKKWGHHVDVAENGEQAIQHWQQRAYDLILMDVQMPVMDGMEATRRIRKLEGETSSHIPIVAMTAHAMKGDRERCIQVGMDSYVAKPFRKHDLYNVLREFFSIDKQPTLETKRESIESPSAHIDWQQALEMVAGEAGILNDVATAASQEFPELLDTLEQSISQQDLAGAQRAAHTIKSSSRILAAHEVVELSVEAERAAIARDIQGVESAAKCLRRLITDVVREIDAFLEVSAESSNRTQ